jgi:hypothetical protein
MPKHNNADEFSSEETEQRVQAALRGAFKGSPVAMKDIPRKPRATRTKTAKNTGRKSA